MIFERISSLYKTKGADITCFLVGDYDAKATEAAGEYLDDQQVCVVVDDGNPPCSTMAKRSSASWRTRSVTSCTTNGTSAGADTIVEAVSCFPAAWKAWPWTKTSSPTSPRGESAQYIRVCAWLARTIADSEPPARTAFVVVFANADALLHRFETAVGFRYGRGRHHARRCGCIFGSGHWCRGSRVSKAFRLACRDTGNGLSLN